MEKYKVELCNLNCSLLLHKLHVSVMQKTVTKIMASS
jgi:hypothetical protein